MTKIIRERLMPFFRGSVCLVIAVPICSAEPVPARPGAAALLVADRKLNLPVLVSPR